MTYPGRWETVLILSQCLDTSWTLFLVPMDVSLWDVNPATDQTPLKGSDLVPSRWVLLVLRVLAGRPLFSCMHHPQLKSHVTKFEIRAIFHITIWLKNRYIWAMRDRSYGRRNIGVLDMVVVLAIYSF